MGRSKGRPRLSERPSRPPARKFPQHRCEFAGKDTAHRAQHRTEHGNEGEGVRKCRSRRRTGVQWPVSRSPGPGRSGAGSRTVATCSRRSRRFARAASPMRSGCPQRTARAFAGCSGSEVFDPGLPARRDGPSRTSPPGAQPGPRTRTHKTTDRTRIDDEGSP